MAWTGLSDDQLAQYGSKTAYTMGDNPTEFNPYGQYAPYMSQQWMPGSEAGSGSNVWGIDLDAYNTAQQQAQQQAASYGITAPTYEGAGAVYNQQIAPLQYSGQDIIQRWTDTQQGNTFNPLTTPELQYLNQNYSDWQTRLAPELEKYAYQKNLTGATGGDMNDWSNWLYNTPIATGGLNETLRNDVNTMLANAYGSQWQADPWNQIRAQTQQGLDATLAANQDTPVNWGMLLGAVAAPWLAGALTGTLGSGMAAGGANIGAGGVVGPTGGMWGEAALGGMDALSGSLGGVAPPEGYMSNMDLGGFGDMAAGPYDPALNAGTGAFDISGSAGTGLPGSVGGSGTGSLTDLIQQIQQMTGNMPPGSTSAIQKLLGGAMGGGTGGTSGTGTGTGGLGGMGDIFNWLTSAQGGAGALSGILGYNDAADQTDWMKQTMERAVGASDPYGYGPYRKYAADQLQRTYQDPASIYASPEMQALDQMFMDKTMAGQSVSGNLFNAPERVAQRQNNFYANLNDYRKPLLQMSGSGQALVAPQTYASFAKSISDLQGDQALAKGNMIGGITGGLNTLFGGGGTSGGLPQGAMTGTGGLGDVWNLISGGGFGGGFGGGWDWPTAGGVDSFYSAGDLLDLWL